MDCAAKLETALGNHRENEKNTSVFVSSTERLNLLPPSYNPLASSLLAAHRFLVKQQQQVNAHERQDSICDSEAGITLPGLWLKGSRRVVRACANKSFRHRHHHGVFSFSFLFPFSICDYVCVFSILGHVHRCAPCLFFASWNEVWEFC